MTDSRKRTTLIASTVLSLGLVMLLGGAGAAEAAARFGTYCQQDFQNGWQVTTPYTWARCSAFNNELATTDFKIFYFNLSNKKYYLERFGDHQPGLDSADDVDLLFINTHGGAFTNPVTAAYAMYEQGQLAFSTEMRLGDSAWWGGGLAVLATYSCKTLKVDDNSLVARWAPALRGGLKMILGSHDLVWDSSTTDEVGEDFADDIQHQMSFKSAWSSALSDWSVDQDVAVVATGANAGDCWSRMDNMKWQNYGGYPFLRDGNIGYTCWTWWDNL